VRLVKLLFLFVALQSPALAQSDGAGLAAGAKAAADQLQLYLDGVAKAGERPDFAKAPAAQLFARIFAVEQLNALPPPQANDIPWLLDWVAAANQTNKAIMFFGIERPANAVAAARNAAFVRNVLDYQDQQAIELDFLIRLTARESTAMDAFMRQLAPEQRTPIREAGVKKARAGFAQMISGALGSMADEHLKPTYARRVSAAMRDTGDIWLGALLPDDRTKIISQLQWAQLKVKDDAAQENLAAFSAVLAAAK
jgi:hypothetical protein